VIEIIGPLALCHRTSVYGRAISGLVPLLASCESFELAIALHSPYGTYEARTRSPVLLPAPPVHLGGPTAIVARLARDLERVSSDAEDMNDARVTLAPPALVTGGVVACPDLVVDLDGVHWYVELVGFWTTPYLERKLRGYGRANVVLCIDETRACADDTAPAQVMPYTRRIDAAALLARMRSG
jgi:predicted nuclease of restriction endonuclease-like RecB superfamily